MNVRFVAGFAAIVEDAAKARQFYGEQLALPTKSEENSDYTTVDLPGMKHFGLWTLRDAARSVFDRADWPADVPVPQATVEFEVDDVASAVEELLSRGLRHPAGHKARALGTDDRSAALARRPTHRDRLQPHATRGGLS